MIKSKKQMYTVIGAFALVLMLGTITYAFFNYTRIGVANNIRTGRIYFNSTQNGTLNLTNLFPVASNEVGDDNQIEVRLYGDTTYTGGEEFEITLVSVNNTITSGSTEKTIPVNYIATYAATPVATGEDPNNIGMSSNDYFNDRGSTTAVYQLKSSGEVTEGEQVLIGYIPKDVAIDGTLTIKAYLDASNIAISDTFPSGNVTHTEASGETSVEEVDYTNGTTNEWVAGRTVITTDEWNSLQNTPISFKVKAESNEGVWITKPSFRGTASQLASSASLYGLETTDYGNIYVGSSPNNYVWFNNEQWRILGVYDDKLKIVKAIPLEENGTVIGKDYDDDSNTWEGSDLEEWLNDEVNGYYSTLSPIAKGMIVGGTWNAGTTAFRVNGITAYSDAQTTQITNKKVGLLTSYEYLFAAGNSCQTIVGDYDNFITNSGCASHDWLNPIGAYVWTISPNGATTTALLIYSSGSVGYNYVANHFIGSTIGVLPVVYLNSSVAIIGGTGEIGEANSYKLG